ncbi:hypothetical protein Tco_1231031 [Tanacetum coccineum]
MYPCLLTGGISQRQLQLEDEHSEADIASVRSSRLEGIDSYLHRHRRSGTRVKNLDPDQRSGKERIQSKIPCSAAERCDIYSIIASIQPEAKRRTTKIIIVKLVIAASAYFLWQERNWRWFKKSKRTTSHVIECAVSSVRLKLLSCKLKKSKDSQMFATLWDLPEAIFV